MVCRNCGAENVTSAKDTESKKISNNNFRFNSKFLKLGSIVFVIVILWAIF